MNLMTRIPDRPRLETILLRPEQSVKSAMRVLEILEYFDDIQQGAHIVDVCRALNYPQSSASALLKTLAAAGYLRYDPQNRTYVTAPRTTLLGGWLSNKFSRSGRLIDMMQEINEATGELVVLATRNGIHAQYIHAAQAHDPARMHVSIGTIRPLISSSAGYALLSETKDSEIVKLVNRINVEEAAANKPPRRPGEVVEKVAEVRKLGYAFFTDQVKVGSGMLAAPLPHRLDEPMLVIGIGADTKDLVRQKDDLIALLVEKLADYKTYLRSGASTN